jgi:5-methylcytosine-specific restriction endonuclease McrA
MDSNFIDNLKHLYEGKTINEIWNLMSSHPIIQHPEFGLISPSQYRAKFHGKVCPFCGEKMVHGRLLHSTPLKKTAIDRGYEYLDKTGKKHIHKAGGRYFHPHYVTLDHKINKARCPELMFEYDNLQIMCWKCNREKGDNNNYEIEISLDFADDLAKSALEKYKTL